jgi:hypothetical protein
MGMPGTFKPRFGPGFGFRNTREVPVVQGTRNWGCPNRAEYEQLEGGPTSKSSHRGLLTILAVSSQCRSERALLRYQFQRQERTHQPPLT